MTDFLIGTGGWSYFQIPGIAPLKAYSGLFNFVEVNSTFYEYPHLRVVEAWRQMVPSDFCFSVRCHQDLTHRVGLKPADEAYEIFLKMQTYCRILKAPFLVLETPASQGLDASGVSDAKNFLSSISTDGLRLVWEYRPPMTKDIWQLMDDFRIVQSVDHSRQKPTVPSDVVYSRLFGKGKHNIYQFTDQELLDIEEAVEIPETKIVAFSFHTQRMFSDAARFKQHKLYGKFLNVTSAVGAESAKAVLSEDANFPSTKAQLIADQGWKVIDLTAERKIHLADVLIKIPEVTYRSLNEVVSALEGVI